jgi:thiamine-phosphate pyrophosphorylase
VRQSFDLSLYLIIGPAHCAGRDMAEVAMAAAEGGASIVQLRDKASGTGRMVQDARRLKECLAPFGVPLLINDRVDVALAAGADGVHIGQQDMDPVDARHLLGDDAIIGLTVKFHHEAEAIPLSVVDYASIGGVFATVSKQNPDPPIGLDGLASIAATIDLPLVAIAGITRETTPQVIAAGVGGVAVISAVCAAPDPRAAAAELRAIVNGAMAERER